VPPEVSQEALPAGVIEHQVTTADGEALKVLELKTSNTAPYILFFHGNGSLARYEIGRGQVLREAGYNVLLAEYRGYGGSSGRPSSKAILEDALLLHDWLITQGASSIYVSGHSLGTGPATYIAANREVKALALEAPYSSLADVAADRYPFAPVKLLFKHDINSAENVRLVDEPVLIMHGTRDQVIPIKFGKKLYSSAKSTDKFVEIESAGHGLARYGSIDRIVDFFKLNSK